MSKHDHDPERRVKFLVFAQELNPDIDPESLRLMDSLRKTSHAVYRAGEDSLAEAGISYARFRLLMHLLFAEEIDGRSELNPSEISEKQGISRNTVSSLIRELENEELIDRHLDKKDRRRFKIRLTENGRLRSNTALHQFNCLHWGDNHPATNAVTNGRLHPSSYKINHKKSPTF